MHQAQLIELAAAIADGTRALEEELKEKRALSHLPPRRLRHDNEAPISAFSVT